MGCWMKVKGNTLCHRFHFIMRTLETSLKTALNSRDFSSYQHCRKWTMLKGSRVASEVRGILRDMKHYRQRREEEYEKEFTVKLAGLDLSNERVKIRSTGFLPSFLTQKFGLLRSTLYMKQGKLQAKEENEHGTSVL